MTPARRRTALISTILGLSLLVALLSSEGRNGTAQTVLLVLAAALTGALVQSTVGGRGLLYAPEVDSDNLDGLISSLPAGHRERVTALVQGMEAQHEQAKADARQARGRADSMQEGLWAMVETSTRAEERARSYMVAELHDGPAQSLTAAILMADDEDSRQTEIIRSAEQELREVMTFAIPPALRESCLLDVLHGMTLMLAGRGLSVEWEYHLKDAPERISEAVALTTYRFFQESLTNCRKHGGVSTAQACLSIDADGVLNATVNDDGKGFRVDASRGERLGLTMMAERAEQIGADLVVESEPGQGTWVTLRVPPTPRSSVLVRIHPDPR